MSSRARCGTKCCGADTGSSSGSSSIGTLPWSSHVCPHLAGYIVATRKDGPLYVGFANDIERRIAEHKSHAIKGHAAKYNIDMLVELETFDDPSQTIAREKALKNWRRAWKVALIEKDNPDWRDLAD